MNTFTTLTTITGRKIKVRGNDSKRHYTIVTNSGKYRTFPMNKEDYNSNRHNTGNDWNNFLKGNNYFTVN